MKLSAQGKLRLAAKLAFAAGASSLVGVAQAADGTAAAPASSSSSADSGLLLAQAGTNPAPAAKSAKTPVVLQGVEVTGSRIPQPSLTSSAALQTINSKEFKLSGTVNVESLLNSFPQVFAGQTEAANNGGTGTATVDLRGLGASRTLVLIDGKRIVPGDPTSFGGPEADLNFIPAALIDHVEVLTGGASSVYGSDAISGVVNFIMKKDYQGFNVDGQWDMTDHGDGTSYTSTVIWGANNADGSANVTLYAGYTRFDSILQGARDYSTSALIASGNRHVPIGSYTTPNATIIDLDPTAAINSPPYYGYGQVNPNGSHSLVPATSTFNFNPFNYLRRPDKRYNLGGFAHKEFNEHLDLYGSAMFMTDQTQFQLAPSGTFFKDVVTLDCNTNPLLQGQTKQLLCTNQDGSARSNTTFLIGKRAVEFGPRQDNLRHTDYRIVIGAKGAINEAWTYNVSAQRSQAIFSENFQNDLSSSRFLNAIQVVGNPNDPSTWQCASAQAQAEGCVPFNILQYSAAAGSSPLSQAAINYVRGNGFSQGASTEQVVTSSVTGDLGQYGVTSPFAKGAVEVAGGFEYRTEGLDYRTDHAFSSGDLAGQGGPIPSLNGGFQVRDWFGELQAPLVQDKPGVKLLQLDTAYRLSNYSTAARYVHAYKLGLRYAPTDDVTFRASWNRAVRAPDIQELFFPQSVALFGGSDPCAGKTPSATLAQCERTGVTQQQYGNITQCSASQCNQLIGGNPNLQAERAITRQAGLVFTPRFLKGFTGTIDFYQITIGNPIGAVGPTTVLTQCINNGTFCDRIHRGPGGVLFGPNTAFVEATNVNVGSLKERGIDFSLDYDRYLSDIGLGDTGRVDINFVGTYLSSLQTNPGAGATPYDCAGLYGPTCGTPNPRWRHVMRTTWQSPGDWVTAGLGVSVRWRYFGSVTLDKNSTQSGLKSKKPSPVDNKLPIKQYVDLTLTYQLPLQQQDVMLRFGVNNLGNEGPPIVGLQNGPGTGAFSANTFPGVYDSLGRVFFLGATARFN